MKHSAQKFNFNISCMEKVKLRFLFLSLILTVLILTVFLVLKSLEDNVVYFISPSDIKELGEIDYDKNIELEEWLKILFL